MESYREKGKKKKKKTTSIHFWNCHYKGVHATPKPRNKNFILVFLMGDKDTATWPWSVSLSGVFSRKLDQNWLLLQVNTQPQHPMLPPVIWFLTNNSLQTEMLMYWGYPWCFKWCKGTSFSGLVPSCMLLLNGGLPENWDLAVGEAVQLLFLGWTNPVLTEARFSLAMSAWLLSWTSL